MSAELLRRAAALMRKRAEAATPGPWFQNAEPRNAKVRTSALAADLDDEIAVTVDVPDAEYIASWHPAVALAVADWIEIQGRDLESAGGHLTSCDSPGDVEQALTVARVYLGEDS